MKILVDENIPRRTVGALRALGHEVIDLRGTPQEGAADEDVWCLATTANALLITTDKYFAQKRNEAHSGIIVIRLRRPNRAAIHDRVLYALGSVREEDWPGLLLTMRDKVQTRFRRRSG